MKNVVSIIGFVGLCVGSAHAAMLTETAVVAQQGVTSEGTTGPDTLNFTGSQFNSSLGTLNSVSLSLVANLGDSSVTAITLPGGSGPWPISWNYSGSVSLSGFALSSAWNGSGTVSANPSAPLTSESISIGLSDPSASTLLITSDLSQFIGGSTFDLAGALNTAASWGSTPNNNNANELANFLPDAGGTLEVTYNYTPSPVPEPTTMIAGATMLLPFGFGMLRTLRRGRTA